MNKLVLILELTKTTLGREFLCDLFIYDKKKLQIKDDVIF